MKRSDQDRLLKEIFATDEPAAFRKVSLERGLTVLKRRKELRRGISLGAIMALLVLAAWQLITANHSVILQRKTPVTSPFSTSVNLRGVKVKFITDDELLALFPHRSVALVGKPGHQRLVFLDETNIRTNEKM